MTVIALIAVIAAGVIAEALGFSLGILVGLQIAKERKHVSDKNKRKKEISSLTKRDSRW